MSIFVGVAFQEKGKFLGEKRENAAYQHFLFFQRIFRKNGACVEKDQRVPH